MQHSGIATRKKKIRLWRENNGRCHYCGVKTMIPRSGKDYPIAPKNMATLDHIYSKNDIRFYIKSAKHQVVLSCLKCNVDKNERETEPRKQWNFQLFNPFFDIRDFLINSQTKPPGLYP